MLDARTLGAGLRLDVSKHNFMNWAQLVVRGQLRGYLLAQLPTSGKGKPRLGVSSVPIKKQAAGPEEICARDGRENSRLQKLATYYSDKQMATFKVQQYP